MCLVFFSHCMTLEHISKSQEEEEKRKSFIKVFFLNRYFITRKIAWYRVDMKSIQDLVENEKASFVISFEKEYSPNHWDYSHWLLVHRMVLLNWLMSMYEADEEDGMVMNREKVVVANQLKENHQWMISVQELMLLLVVVTDNLDWTIWPLIMFVER